MQKLDKQYLKVLRESLPFKGANKIREYLNNEFSTSYIRSVLQGDRQRDEIINAAIEIAKEEKAKMEIIKNEILELASK